MRIVVTGGAGFVGSHITDALVERGDDVAVIDNLETGHRENVHAEACFVEGDAVPLLVETCQEWAPEVIVHCAASYADPDAWEQDGRTNLAGMLAVLRACRERDVERVVYFQTSLCYGLNVPRTPLPENWPLDPHGSYAITKTAAEAFLLDHAPNPISFRMANLYGPRNVSGPLPAFAKRLAAGERCTVVRQSRRDFVYIADAVPLFLQAINGQGAAGAYHVASGRDFPIETIYELASLNVRPPGGGVHAPPLMIDRPPDDAPTILLDPTRTRDVFGWTPTTRLDEGVARACAWYADHGVAAAYTHLAVR